MHEPVIMSVLNTRILLPSYEDVITLGVPHFLTLREPEPGGRGGGGCQ